ncbi:hypothetical protein UlMin_003940 [Ulmus minor]
MCFVFKITFMALTSIICSFLYNSVASPRVFKTWSSFSGYDSIQLSSKFYEAKPETKEYLCSIVKKQLALGDESSVSGESKRFRKIGADSLHTFGINVEEESTQTISTVQDVADLIGSSLRKLLRGKRERERQYQIIEANLLKGIN